MRTENNDSVYFKAQVCVQVLSATIAPVAVAKVLLLTLAS